MSNLGAAWRSLRRTPGFTLISIIILAVGIGGSTAVFSVVNQVLLAPLPYAESGRLVRLYQYRLDRPATTEYVAAPVFALLREQQSLEEAAAIYTYHEFGADLTGPAGVERVRRLPVTSGYFQVLRAEPVLGRGFLPEEERVADVRVVVISHDLWQRRFAGDRDVVGRTVSMSAETFEIVGVAPPGLRDPVAGAVDVWVPHYLAPDDDPQNHALTVIARLRGGTSLQQAEAELQHTNTQLASLYEDNTNRPLRMVGLHEDMVGGSSRLLYLLMGAVMLVLLIACVNIANLLLARATTRSREFAVRAALGAGRARLAWQLLLESLLLGALGGVAGVALGVLLLDAVVAIGRDAVPRLADAHFDPRVLVFSTILTVGSVLAFGMLPALRFSRVAAAGVIRDNARNVTADRAHNRVRRILAGAQVAIAFVLLTGASILTLSLYRLRHVDLGVTEQNVLTFEVHLPTASYDSLRRAGFHEEFARRVAALAGVEAAGAISRLPATGTFHPWGARAASGPRAGERETIRAQQRVVSGDYFAVMRIPLRQGRLFDERDDASVPRRAVISAAAAAAMFADANPLGQKVLVLGDTLEVIGVVGDVALNVEGEPVAHIYHAHRQFAANRNWALTQVVRVTGDAAVVLPAVRAQLAALDADLVLHKPQTLQDVLGRSSAQRRFTTWLMTSFAGLAVVLACLGLFGVITFIVRQRRREIGIRGALGARPSHIRGMVLGESLQVAAVGIVVGLLAAIAGGRVLSALVFETRPAEPVVLLGAVLVMGAAASLAAYLPAREATTVDPGIVLKQE